MKNRWRIGLVTLGLTLISLGILLVLPLFEINTWFLLRFWPVILICLGVELILYMLFCKDEVKRLQFSAGSITLLILVMLFCAIAGSVSSAAEHWGIDGRHLNLSSLVHFGDEDGRVRDRASKTVELKGSEMHLDLSAAKLTVKQAEDGNMTAKITAETRRPQQSAKDALARVQWTENSLFLNSEGKDGGATYEVLLFLPKGVALKVDAAACQIDLEGLCSDLNLKLVAGELSCRNLQGDLKLSATAAQTKLEEIDGNLEAELSVGQCDLKGITGVVTGSLGIGDYSIDPVHPLKTGWKLSVNEGNLEFTMPKESFGGIALDGRNTVIETDAFRELIARDGTAISFKVPAGKEPALKLTTRNARISLEAVDHLRELQ